LRHQNRSTPCNGGAAQTLPTTRAFDRFSINGKTARAHFLELICILRGRAARCHAPAMHYYLYVFCLRFCRAGVWRDVAGGTTRKQVSTRRFARGPAPRACITP